MKRAIAIIMTALMLTGVLTACGASMSMDTGRGYGNVSTTPNGNVNGGENNYGGSGMTGSYGGNNTTGGMSRGGSGMTGGYGSSGSGMSGGSGMTGSTGSSGTGMTGGR